VHSARVDAARPHRRRAPLAARFPCHVTLRIRRGPVLADRYHLRVLRTPREVRNALAYVLLDVRKHWWERHDGAPPERLDAASSGRWFDGWRRVPGSREPPPGALEPREVALPRTWLLSIGWRRHGLVDPAEVPGR